MNTFQALGAKADTGLAKIKAETIEKTARYHNKLLLGALIVVAIIAVLSVILIIIQTLAKTYDFKNATVEGGNTATDTTSVSDSSIVIKGKLPVSKGIGIGYIFCSSVIFVGSLIAIALAALAYLGNTTTINQLKKENPEPLNS